MKVHVLIYPDLSVDDITAEIKNIQKGGDKSAIVNYCELSALGKLESLDADYYHYVHAADEAFSRRGRRVIAHHHVDRNKLNDHLINSMEVELNGVSAEFIFGGVPLKVEKVVEQEIVEEKDELLHEHEDGTIHSHEGGDEDHEHVEDLEDEEVEDNDVSDDSDTSGGANPWVWDHKSS